MAAAGLMVYVSVLDFRASGWSLNPSQGEWILFWERRLTLIVLIFIKVHDYSMASSFLEPSIS